MRKFIKFIGLLMYLILPILSFSIVYLLAGFYYMDLNANNWSRGARLLIGLEGAVLFFAGIFAAWLINKELDEKKS